MLFCVTWYYYSCTHLTFETRGGCRFIQLMKGNIWIESEGLGKGTTITFVVKLGVCNHPNALPLLPMAPRGRLNQGSDDLFRYRQFRGDDGGMVGTVQRYQRSL